MYTVSRRIPHKIIDYSLLYCQCTKFNVEVSEGYTYACIFYHLIDKFNEIL